MIFKNIELFNVTELRPDANGVGFEFCRLPASLDEHLSSGGVRMNHEATGIELRFVMKGDAITLRLVSVPAAEGRAVEAHYVNVYFGNILGGWMDQEVNRIVYGTPTDIVIKRPAAMASYKKISAQYGFPYDPEVLRVILEPGMYRLLDVIGECEPPAEAQLPKRRYLAYGSSITHGSLALNPAYYYPTKIGEYFGAETRNLGYAGSACVEPQMADELAKLPFDFATVEMGINVLSMETEEFDRRVRYMIRRLAETHPDAEIFCISPFYCDADWRGSEKPNEFRRVIAEAVAAYGSPCVHAIDGLSCLDGAHGLSGDLVHPSPRGVACIAENLINQLKPYLA